MVRSRLVLMVELYIRYSVGVISEEGEECGIGRDARTMI